MKDSEREEFEANVTVIMNTLMPYLLELVDAARDNKTPPTMFLSEPMHGEIQVGPPDALRQQFWQQAFMETFRLFSTSTPAAKVAAGCGIAADLCLAEFDKRFPS